MSGVIKSIGKAFKKVTKVIKKIALPALAIGAVVLTGGAALGLLPSIGALGGSLGLSAGLTGILSTAASGATFGFAGALLTGKNPIKGATMGLVTGAVAGGIGALASPTASTAATGASTAGGGAASAASPGAAMGNGVQAMNVNSSVAGLGGIGSATAPGVAAITPSAAGAVAAAPQVAAVPTGSSGGFMGFLNRNPTLTAGLIQGIGSGMVASEQSKQAERERAAVAANYGDMGGLFTMPEGYGATGQPAAERYDGAVYGRVKYDPNTGRVLARG